jgi:hypothetical protein
MNAPTIPVTDNVADLDCGTAENESPKALIVGRALTGLRSTLLPTGMATGRIHPSLVSQDPFTTATTRRSSK